MDDAGGFSFEDFSIEMEEFEVRKVRKHDRMWKIEEGGSVDQIVLVHDGVVYFGSLNRMFYAVRLSDAKKLWQFRTEGMILESSPAYCDGKVYFGSFDRNFYCLDAKTGSLQWKFETSGRINAAPHVSCGKAYIGSEDHNMYCLDAATGALVWKFRTHDEVQCNPIVHEGKLLFGSFDHNFYCLDAGNGSLVWKFQTQGEMYHVNKPLIHEGIVYVGCFDNFVRAIRIKDGSLLWKFKTGNYGCVCCPIMHDGKLYVTSRDGFVFCISMDGREIWKFTRNVPVSVPEVHAGRLYFGCEDQNLYCLSLEGKELWRFPTQGVIWLKAVGTEENVLFPSLDCHVYLVQAATGKLVWKFRTEGEPSPLPPAYDTFEVAIVRERGKIERDGEDGRTYSLRMEDDENSSTYKSKMTYRVSTQYGAKGKYQVDSDEEAF